MPKQTRLRIIVLTDIGNEPDDSESMVRFLLYSNEFDVEGLIASTSTWLRNKVHAELITERVHAYGRVLSNLRVHAAGYPDATYLLDRIKEGRAAYGMSGVGRGRDTDASRLIIEAVDRPDPRPVWVLLWGGATDLAQALWTVRKSRPPKEVAIFVSKLRVYASSDQDDAGPWLRATFPKMFWIASIHAFGCYGRATYIGISSRRAPGADNTMVSREWLAANIQNKGPLGAVYPTPEYIMEGDSASFLYLIPNGLGSPENPNWGSWGGRYGSVGTALGLWTDTEDTVRAIDGSIITDNKATIWRWRTVFQNDFLARMIWSVTPTYIGANHNPELVLNGVPGRAPVEIIARAGEVVKLSAAGSSDPDGNKITYRWWQYLEVTSVLNPQQVSIAGAETSEVEVIAPQAVKPAPNVDIPKQNVFHIILEAKDDGTPPLTSYRRAVITVPTADSPAGIAK